jgi:PEP-CTERM motif
MRRFECSWSVVVTVLLLLAAYPAQAATVVCYPTSSVVSAMTMPAGVYQYEFTLTNTSECTGGGQMWPMIIDFEVPLQSPDSVYKITSPDSWSYSILTSAEFESQFGIPNPFGSAYVLHWYDTLAVDTDPPASWQKSIVPIGFAHYYDSDQYTADVYEDSAVFGFDSLSGPVDGPYESSWSNSGRKPGDPPLPLQYGPVMGAGLPPFSPATVPEPNSWLLLGTALAGLGMVPHLRARRT